MKGLMLSTAEMWGCRRPSRRERGLQGRKHPLLLEP